jgi:hypothetical protein
MEPDPVYDVIDVSYLSDYKILVTFENKEQKIVDLESRIKDLKNTRFEGLLKIEYFKTLSVDKETGTITWDNGFDVCPFLLYQIGENLKNSAVL